MADRFAPLPPGPPWTCPNCEGADVQEMKRVLRILRNSSNLPDAFGRVIDRLVPRRWIDPVGGKWR